MKNKQVRIWVVVSVFILIGLIVGMNFAGPITAETAASRLAQNINSKLVAQDISQDLIHEMETDWRTIWGHQFDNVRTLYDGAFSTPFVADFSVLVPTSELLADKITGLIFCIRKSGDIDPRGYYYMMVGRFDPSLPTSSSYPGYVTEQQIVSWFNVMITGGSGGPPNIFTNIYMGFVNNYQTTSCSLASYATEDVSRGYPCPVFDIPGLGGG